MKIKKIKKLKNGKYKLELEGDRQITTYDTVILDNNLLYEKEVNKKILEKIDAENSYYDIYNKVLKMVSTRLRSEKEIKEYLEKKEVNKQDIDKMLNIFKKNKIINDDAFVKAFIHDRIAFSNDGPFKIKNALLKYDIADDVIDRELKQIDNSVFNEKIKKYVLKKINNNHKSSNSVLKQKMINDLINLGYSDFDIDVYFKESNNIDVIKKEYTKIYNKLCKKYTGKELYFKVYQKLYQKGFSREEIQNELNNLEVFE